MDSRKPQGLANCRGWYHNNVTVRMLLLGSYNKDLSLGLRGEVIS